MIPCSMAMKSSMIFSISAARLFCSTPGRFPENIGSHIILLAMEDITDASSWETEIQDAREYAENIVETVREPMVVLNSDLKILTANHSFYIPSKERPRKQSGISSTTSVTGNGTFPSCGYSSRKSFP